MMNEEEFADLKTDIAANGQKEPVWLYQEQIIDGRNRYRACRELNIQPKTREWNGKGSLTQFVISLNLKRRHLTPSDKAVVATEALPFFEQEAKEAQKAAGAHGQEGGRGKKKPETLGATSIPRVSGKPKKRNKKSAEKAAKATGAGYQSVQAAKKLKTEAPELFEAVKNQTLTVAEGKALSKLDKEQQKQAVELIKNGEAKNAKKAQQAIKQEAARGQAATLPASQLWTVTAEQGIVKCDALITDPPYGILDENWEPEQLETFTREWAARWNECAADFCLIFWSQEHLWTGRQWFDESLSNYSFQQLLIWHYANNKKPQSRDGFKQTWEPIFFYRRKDSDKQILVDDTSGEWGKDQNDFDCHVAAVPQSNFNDVNCKEHPAQKPASVMRWLVGAATRLGDLICDPFTGSGTTGIAASQLKRRFHGIEISAEYRQMAEARIKLYGA